MKNIWKRGQQVRTAWRSSNSKQRRYWRRDDKHHFYAQLNPEQQEEWKKQQEELKTARGEGKIVNVVIGEGRLELFRLSPDGNQAYRLRSPLSATATEFKVAPVTPSQKDGHTAATAAAEKQLAKGTERTAPVAKVTAVACEVMELPVEAGGAEQGEDIEYTELTAPVEKVAAVAREVMELPVEAGGAEQGEGIEDMYGRVRVPCTLTPGCGQLRRMNGALCVSCGAVDFTTAVICSGCNQLTSKLTPTGLPDQECRNLGCHGVACDGESAANVPDRAKNNARLIARDVVRLRYGGNWLEDDVSYYF